MLNYKYEKMSRFTLSNGSYFMGFLTAQEGRETSAIWVNDVYYSYADLQARVASAASLIHNQGFHQEKIAVYLKDDIHTYVAILAIWSSGNIYVPIHPSYPVYRVEQIYDVARFAAAFHLPSSWEIASNGSVLNWNLGETPIVPGEMPKVREYGTDEICYCLFTSGSTGVPKGVQISYANLKAFIESSYALDLQIAPGEGCLQMFELTFDLSIVSTLWPLMHHGTLYHVGNSSSKYTEVYRLLEEFQIGFAVLVPSVLNMLRPYFEEIQLPNLKIIGLCGEAALTDVMMEAKSCWPQARFFNFYGPTECTIYCTAFEIPPENCLDENGIISIGRPMHHVQFVIADEEGRVLEPGSKGLLWIGGQQVMPGYLGNEGLTTAVIREIQGQRFYNTGDIVRLDDSGELLYLGRADQQVKINGYRIEISEIEYNVKNALESPCAVIAVRDQKGIDRLVLFMLQNAQHTESVVQSTLMEKIPRYMVPERVLMLDEFPMNSNGKLDRKALKQQYESHHL